ncbi:hypothetical protein ASF11_08440 [Acidovorax sp. Leaf76]|uniref:hypothetical protein n=1 Tax=unclassified Acidovorax TaxID=2684926 RepID=UPI0006F46961|nr:MULTISPECIES: hypothetical protein [unclassified Acidovorax]KQO16226.1 hypothetical protein ASF11_08440 [Acidovorax sp. Leaf76]KQS31859.1 hypothetical protein ASG27_07560 [Acidovorax sp. Leaf191]
MSSLFASPSAAAGALLALAACAWAGHAHADYVWLQRDGAQARAYAGELPRRSAALPPLQAPRAYLADGKDLPVAPQAGHIDITAPGGDDLRLSTLHVTGHGAVTYYQARNGRTETRAANDLELVPTTPGGNTFKLVWKGQTVAASQVNVDTSAGWRRTLAPAADGTVQLETPFPGLYVLEVSAKVNGSVTVDGKKYDDVRHTATLSFEVPR